jgi:DNA-binding GntR family transcriptional regulator
LLNRPVVRTIREQITEHIRRDVLSGQLEPGEQLREQVLAERFGVSRGPIRDALLQLTQEGLLVAAPNRGVSVSLRSSEEIQPLIVQLRRDTEVFALRLAFDKFDDNTVSKLTEMAERMREDFERGNIKDLAEHDMAFHRAMVEMADDDDIVAIWVPIVARMFLHYTRYKDPINIYEEHMAVIEAIRQNNLKGAIAALEKNII